MAAAQERRKSVQPWTAHRPALRRGAVPQWPALRSFPPLAQRAVVLREHGTSKLWLRSEHPDHYAELKNTTCTQLTRIYSCNVAMYFLACQVIYSDNYMNQN